MYVGGNSPCCSWSFSPICVRIDSQQQTNLRTKLSVGDSKSPELNYPGTISLLLM